MNGPFGRLAAWLVVEVSGDDRVPASMEDPAMKVVSDRKMKKKLAQLRYVETLELFILDAHLLVSITCIFLSFHFKEALFSLPIKRA